jgi:hypothetical protein
MLNIFLKSLKDILSPTTLGFILKVGFGSIFAWSIILFFSWDGFSALVSSLVSHIPYIGKFDFVKEGSSFILALVTGYILVIVTISILTSLYAPKILAKLAKKHYPNVVVKDESNIAKSIAITLKSSAIFLLLFIIFLPIIIFVPVVGQIIMLWLWALLLKDPTLYDVSNLFPNQKEIKSTKSLWIIAIIASLFNYIPILNIFATLFAYIMFMHWYLSRK